MTNISISKSELLKRLQLVSKIISSKPTLPIMSCILFDLKDGELNISAADYLGRINTTITNITSTGDVSICFEAKILIEALKTLPEQPVTFEIDEQNLSTIIRYKGGKFEIVGKSAKDFPQATDLPGATAIDISADVFLSGISKTVMCAADDELRPVMNSVYIEMGDASINHVASTGTVLALVEHKDESLQGSISFVLPQKIASILKGLVHPSSDGTIKLIVGTSKVRFEYESESIVATLLEGRYPNYRSVIPANNDKVMTIGTSELKNALNRVLVFTNQSSRLVKLELSDNQLLLTGQDLDYSTCADEKIECEYSGSAFAIGFKGNYLAELIAAVSCSELTMSFSDPYRAALISPVDNSDEDKLTYLIMPMALNN